MSTLIPTGNSDSAINDTINDGTPITVANVHTPTAATAVLLSIALLALPFLPAANLFFYVGFVVAERILYLPSVGYCLLVGLGMGRLMDPNRGPFRSQRKRWAALFCVGLVLMAYSVKTFNRNGDWRDEESLYRSAIGVNPPKGNFIDLIESICSPPARVTILCGLAILLIASVYHFEMISFVLLRINYIALNSDGRLDRYPKIVAQPKLLPGN